MIDGIVKHELKNWSQFFPSTIKTQFIRDLSNIDNLAQLKWIFNKTGGIPDIGTLKTKVMKALKKADGKTPLVRASQPNQTKDDASSSL